MKKQIVQIVTWALSLTAIAQPTSVKNIDQKVDSLMKLMTLEEKIGQLNQLTADFATGNLEGAKAKSELDQLIKDGKVSSFLNVNGMENKIRFQEVAVKQSRLKIPIIIGQDVIHGYKTIFPIPLAQSCSWDLFAIENAERIAATEASADGVHWTFAPMMDIGRDPRWGRVMEGAGEDTWLGSKIASARVKGFQGQDLSKDNTILACAKHFAGYGFSESGREYNTVELSERFVREVVLPPFKAASDAGVGSFMNSFNVLWGVPASGNKHLVKDILKDEWGFKGFVVSDWESVGEMIVHGAVKDSAEAASKAMNAQSSDMEMVSSTYINHLKKLVDQGKVKQANIDDACRRILKMKFALGLFEDPFRYFNPKRAATAMLTQENLAATRDLARKSMVLLKNEGKILPLKKDIKTIALIGPFADGKEDRDYMSFWTFKGDQKDVVTLLTGIKNKVSPQTKILTASVCGFMGKCNDNEIKKAIELAKQADVVILALGENGERNGEYRSRAYLNLPGNQQDLAKAVIAIGKPTVAVLFNGRPLTLEWESKNIPAILEAWQPGTQAGNAVADVLFGDYNPAGKLTMSFPITVGQIPVYYNQLNTGRPIEGKPNWNSSYTDIPNTPLYPFGFGLSYTTFKYGELALNKAEINASETIEASISVTNTGTVAGEEVVQLYIRDLVADVARPIKELKGFQKISLKPGETKNVVFKLNIEDLKYWNEDLKFKADAGEFKIIVGSSSIDTKEKMFTLK